MVCLLSNRKKRTHVINFFLIESGQPSFYAENIPFSSSTIFSSSPTPKLVLQARHICARFDQPCAWFLLLYSPPISRSQRWQSGGGYFRHKGKKRTLLLLLQWVHCLAQNLHRHSAADSLPFSQKTLCCWSLPPLWWHSGEGADPLRGRVSHPPKSIVG